MLLKMINHFDHFLIARRVLSSVVGRSRVFRYAVLFLLFALIYATEQQVSAEEAQSELSKAENGDNHHEMSRKTGGVPVPKIFQVSPEDFHGTAFDDSQNLSEQRASELGSSREANAEGGSGVEVSKTIGVDAFSRVDATFGNVLVLSDVDDTMWSSGSLTFLGKHLGGVDTDLERGLPYPGYGAFLFLLALGPHTCTPRGTRIPKEFCPVPREYLRTHNCPLEHVGDPVVPVGPGILSARNTSSLLSGLTRPASFYRDVDAVCSRGMWHILRSTASAWKVSFENSIPLMYGFSSQHARGAAKVQGYIEAAARGQRIVFVGDSGEKDVEAGAGMAVKKPEDLAGVFIHSVFPSAEAEIEAAGDENKNEMPSHAIKFFVDVNGKQVPALQLVYNVVVKVKEGERVESFSAMSEKLAYAAGALIAADLRQVFLVAVRKRLVALYSTRHKRDSLDPIPPLLVFVHVADLKIQRADPEQYSGVARQIANVARRFSSWSLKLSSAPKVDKLAEFRKEVQLEPVLQSQPVQGVTSGIPYPKGVPFVQYRTVVGAGVGSFALGMTTPQDLVSLIVASVRDLRALGPPTHCWQRSVVQGLLVDVLSAEQFGGPLASRADLLEIGVYKDAVAALLSFDQSHHHHCKSEGENATPLAVCLADLEAAIKEYPSEEPGFAEALFPVLSLACRYREQLDHWKSAGAEEVESFAYLLGRALVLGMAAFTLSSSPEGHGKQQHEPASVSGRLSRDLRVYPSLAVDYHVDPHSPPSSVSSLLEFSSIDAQTSEDLSPYVEDPGVFFDFGLPGMLEAGEEGTVGDTSPRAFGESAHGESVESLYSREGPIGTLFEYLRSFCNESRHTRAIEVCGRMRRWLGDDGGQDGSSNRGALPVLVKVADWNTQKTQTVLELLDMGLTLEPPNERPGVTGQDEIDKVGGLSAVGRVSPGKETVRHQRPTERAVWQRIFWVLTTLLDTDSPF